jgi:transcriptional regulator with XRE-family HTH domain
MASVGERLRQIREALGWTQDDLAQKASISKGFLSDVENDKRNISAENALKIADALGASLDYLLKGETGREELKRKPIEIPPALSKAAEELQLKYSETLALLEAHKSVVARRSATTMREFSVEDWKGLHQAIKKVFG